MLCGGLWPCLILYFWPLFNLTKSDFDREDPFFCFEKIQFFFQPEIDKACQEEAKKGFGEFSIMSDKV